MFGHFVKIFVCFAFAETTLLQYPKDTDVVIGSTAYFSCQTNENYNVNWDHVAHARVRKRREVYLAGDIISPYHERFTLKIDPASKFFFLVIKDVQPKDAGTYECVDKEGHGERVGAELTVLESPPNCEYLSAYTTLVGENDCGVEPDSVQFRCRLKYYGNFYPILEWKVTNGSEVKPETVVIEVHHHQVTFDVTIRPTKEANDHSYTCETRAGIRWTSEEVHVLYAHNSYKRTAVHDAGYHRCNENSNLRCKYAWTKDTDDGEEALVTTSQTVYIQSPGHYVCNAICMLNGRECTIRSNSLQVNLKANVGAKTKIAIKDLTTLLYLLALSILAGDM